MAVPPDPLTGPGSPAPGKPGGGVEGADRRRAVGRLVATVVVVGLAVSFVVENVHQVTVHLWLVHRRIDLVWVVGGCLVVGVAVGYWVGWQGHRRAVDRRAARAARGGWWHRSG